VKVLNNSSIDGETPLDLYRLYTAAPVAGIDHVTRTQMPYYTPHYIPSESRLIGTALKYQALGV